MASIAALGAFALLAFASAASGMGTVGLPVLVFGLRLLFLGPVLDRTVVSADPNLCALLEHHDEAMLERLPPTGPMTDRVRAALVDGLRVGQIG